NRLNEVDEKSNPVYTFETVNNLLNKVNSATLVKIDVATHADAFTLFETLNNRGVPLSAIDLIKNKLLGHLEKVDPNTSLDKNFERWNDIITNLTDEYKIQERFLRQFYNAYRLEKEIEVERAPKALRSNLIRIYEELINRDVHSMFDRLEEAAVIYSKNIQYDIEEHSPELIKTLRNLENVNGADGYMLLLFVARRFVISDEEKVKLIKLLCNYFIRRNVTDSPPTRDLTNYFMEIIKAANELEFYSYEAIRNIILTFGKPATDKFFEEKLNGDLYEENVGATRFILSTIELEDSETKEIYVNFYARNKNKFIWTVEHIFPQGENIPDHWVEMIADGDKELAQQVRKDCVHKLGNLTLTGYNSQLSNMSLEKKQERKNNDGKYIGFKNGLSLNEEIKSV
ncbi:MAG: HNH endonuclease family protein, partial [Vicingaceae bacterium]